MRAAGQFADQAVAFALGLGAGGKILDAILGLSVGTPDSPIKAVGGVAGPFSVDRGQEFAPVLEAFWELHVIFVFISQFDRNVWKIFGRI